MAKKRDGTQDLRTHPVGSVAREVAVAELQAKFLEKLRETCSVRIACTEAQVVRSVAYEWREKDPHFAKLWDIAVEEATDELEREARRRAVEGWEEPVYTRDGAMCGTIRRYSDKMLELLLKAYRPTKFRDRVQVEHEIGENLAKRLENARRRMNVIDVTALAAPEE